MIQFKCRFNTIFKFKNPAIHSWAGRKEKGTMKKNLKLSKRGKGTLFGLFTVIYLIYMITVNAGVGNSVIFLLGAGAVYHAYFI